MWVAPVVSEQAWRGEAETPMGTRGASWSASCRESECQEEWEWECWGVTVLARPEPGGLEEAAAAGGSGLE